MNRLAPLLAAALAACTAGPTDPSDSDAPDTDVADTDLADTDIVDTDVADTDVADTDLADTDASCPDADADSVCDADDACPEADDLQDADLDGSADACDLCPLDPDDDLDMDGLCAEVDPCPIDSTNDADSDGVCGADDVCPGYDDLADADADLVPDGCDPCPNDAPDDSDADTVCDSADVCAGDDRFDSDADGVPDDCDACPVDAPDDSDSDGVCDSDDLCAAGDDADDVDADGVPDACDPCPNDAPDDTDHDGVCESADLCAGADDNADADSDGTPDACDICPRDPYDDEDGDTVCLDQDACPYGDNTPGSNGYATDCAVCAPFTSIAAFGPTATSSASFSQVSRLTTTAFGTGTRLSSTTSLDLVSPDLQLPPGDWVLTWRVMGTTTPRDLTLTMTATAGCAYTIDNVWPAANQPANGAWGWSFPLAMHVNGPGVCAVTPHIKNTTVSQTKAGYLFDHVRAEALCRTVDDCPTVAGATAACVPEGRCVWWGEDADSDMLCDAIDLCPDGDDRTHDDADGIPAACDCDDADASVWPGADQLCDVDGDCDGLIDTTVTQGAWMHSLTEYHPAWDGEFVVEEPSVASVYGKVDRTDTLLSWLDYAGGPITYLDAGHYLLDYRLAPTAAGVPLYVAVEPATTSGCVRTTQGTFSTLGAAGQFELSAPLAFEVTRDHCPVATRLWETERIKDNWLMDWARIRRACATAPDCPDLSDGTEGTCQADGACLYVASPACPI